MHFPAPLLSGRLIKRYKRFLADIVLDETGEEITAHCANPGSMRSVNAPGSRVWVSKSDNPKRKLQYSWEMIAVDEALVGINTAHPNRLVEAAILDGTILELQGFKALKREVKYGQNSRIDILLTDENDARTYVEVKNVTLLEEPRMAAFPDSVTARGAKHLQELAAMVAEGHRAVMLFLVQRDDADAMMLARHIDPAYGKAFDAAIAAGVEAYAYTCTLSPEAITVSHALPIREPALEKHTPIANES